MARVKKFLKLESISSKDYERLYEEYQKEFTRVVSTKYRKWGGALVAGQYPDQFNLLNKEQFKVEVDIAKQEGYYGKRLASYVRKLVSTEVKYSAKQNNIILKHINELIKLVWQKVAGRNVRGRASSVYEFSYTNLDDKDLGLYMIMEEHRGANKNYTEYLITLEDVIGQSIYFRALYDYIITEIYSANELYDSGNGA